MDFEKIYNNVLGFYPDRIDISDGEIISETNGYDSCNLTSIYNNADKLACKCDEWHILVAWVLYQTLHETAMAEFIKHNFSLEIRIDKNRFKELLVKNLSLEGYEDMYEEFLNSNW